MALAEVHGAVRIALPRLVEGELEMKAHEADDDQDESDADSGVVSDVLIVDAELPDWSGEATDRQAGRDKNVAAHVLAVHADVDEANVATTVEAGVAAYLSTREDAATIMEAVRSLSDGEREPFGRRVAGALLRSRETSNALDLLTSRECEVLRLLALAATATRRLPTK